MTSHDKRQNEDRELDTVLNFHANEIKKMMSPVTEEFKVMTTFRPPHFQP